MRSQLRVTLLAALILLLAMAASSAKPAKKQLRWYLFSAECLGEMQSADPFRDTALLIRAIHRSRYMGNPAEVQEFLTGENTNHYLNFTEDVSDITGGVYQCCQGQTILPNGSLSSYNASHPPWNLTAYSHLDMYHILSITTNCSAAGAPAGCWTAGDTCQAALSRVDDFADELMAFLEAYSLKGPVLDWEFGYGCNVTCHVELWSKVSKSLRAKGKELAISVDDSKGVADSDPSVGNWSYETDWKLFEPYADVLINMGTYPGGELLRLTSLVACHWGSPWTTFFLSVHQLIYVIVAGWAKGISWPAWEYLKPYPCPTNPARTCGVEGQITDMIENGADPSYQLQPGIWIDECFPNGTMTQQVRWRPQQEPPPSNCLVSVSQIFCCLL